MSITTNYAGKTVDFLILQGTSPYRKSLAELSITNTKGEGMVCTGLQKISQQFLLLFLTTKGSNVWDPDRGTEFMPAILSGAAQTEEGLQSAFSFAVSEVFVYLANKIKPSTPADERLSSAELLSWDYQKDSLILHIGLTSASGETKEYVIPINTVIR